MSASRSRLAIALLIPAYQPGSELIELLHDLSGTSLFSKLIVVNDGSSSPFDPIFKQAAQIPDVHVLHHPVNLGKGAALKSGFRYALEQIAHLSGIVTADADGQHLPKDILNVFTRLTEHPETLVLGVRRFEGSVPWRSSLGNRVSRVAFRLMTGQSITDTQTGLRGVPAPLIPTLLDLTSNGYEFELEMLLLARQNRCHLDEVPIRTVYMPGNHSSHFRPLSDSTKIASAMLKPQAKKAVAGVLLAASALTLDGLTRSQIFAQTIWFPEGWRRALIFVAVFAAIMIPVFAFFHRYLLPIVAAALLALTAILVGPWSPLTVLLFAYSATVIGKLIFRNIEPPLAFLSGTAILIAVEELFVRLPWNYPSTYLLLLLLPIVLAPRIALSTLRSAGALFRPRPLTFPERFAAGVLALILTAHWLMVLKPEVSTDGLAMHLVIPDGVSWKHRFAFEVPHNIWAAMPMGGDWCFTLVYLPGGEFAARLLNLSFLFVVVALLYAACRTIANGTASLWISALFAATPLVQLVTGSLFIENILAAVLLGGVTALWRFHDTGRNRYIYFAALLFGSALHIKFGALAFLLPALVLLAWEMRRGRRLIYAQAAIILILAGAPPYVIAAVETGNPIFPFLNRVFHSPLLAPDAKVDETRFHEPLHVTTPYDLTVHTSRYYEGQNGSFGFQYLLILPASLLLVRRRSYVGWSATFIGLFGSLVVLISQPNLRYLYPALPLLNVTIALLFADFAKRTLATRALIVCCFAASLGADLFLFPSSSWYHKDFYTPRQAYLTGVEPRRLLIADLNAKHPGHAVFLPADSAIAGIRAPVFRNHWHDQSTRNRMEKAHGPDEVLEYMRRWNVQRFLIPVTVEDIGSTVIREFATACVEPDLRIGSYESGHLSALCRQRIQELKNRRDALAARGKIYDDSGSSVQFVGSWIHDANFPLASFDTVTYSNASGASIRFAFQGAEVTYVYTSAANRGIARITLDGTPQPDLDLYSRQTNWQSTVSFDSLKQGKHVLEIAVTGRKNAESKDTYLDLDEFVVVR